MSFVNPWGLVALLSLPAIVVLHWYQRRFPRLAVAGLHLWGAHADARDAGPRRERLPITASLLLELLTALLLALVISRPRFDATDKAAHLVVVLDDSASMATQPIGADSFRKNAVNQLTERIESLPPGSVVTIMRTGRRPTLLAGPGAEPQAAIAALDQWQPAQPRHDFQPAWDYAAQLAGDTGELVFLTDALPDDQTPVPRKMEVVSVGQRADNVAFTTARWELQPAAGNAGPVRGVVGRVFLWVQNFADRPAAVDVIATAGEAEVFRRSFSLPAMEGQAIDAAVPGGVGEMTIELKSQRDELASDSRVVLVEPQQRPVKVAVALPKQPKTAAQFQRVLRLLPAVRFVPADDADLVIAPADPLPPSRESLWWLGVGPLDPSPKAKKESVAPSDEFPYLIEREHPVLKDVRLDGVRWAGVQPLKWSVTPLISAGGHVLLGRLNGTSTTGFILNGDLEHSTLEKSPDWPILLQNLVRERQRALPGLRNWNYRMGEDIVFQLPREQAAGNDDLQLVFGDDRRPVARSSVVQISAPEQTGIYEIRDGNRRIGRFAIRFFDSRESDLTHQAPGRRTPADDTSDSGFLVDEPFSPLLMTMLALAMTALLLDWFVLRPKRR